MRKLFTILFSLLCFSIFAQSGNVGIGTSTPLTKLDIAGAISAQSTTTAVSGNTTITVGNSSYIKITTTNTIPANAKVTLTDGLEDGQLLTLYVAADSLKGVELDNGLNLRLTKTPLNLYGRSASNFVWDGTNKIWIEIGHVPTLPQKQVFTYTGAPQVFTVPVGITSIKVKVWGAGGGSGYGGCATGYSTSGGSGGYVEGVITVTPLQNLEIGVGQGGFISTTGANADGSLDGMGGGAAGGTANSTYGAVGIGGGASYVESFNTGIYYLVAGGGGGAGGTPNSTGTNSFGGAGGGATGGAGGVGSVANSNGKGGTASAGGAGGTGLTNIGAAGSLLQGGNGGNGGTTNCGGGGGGGGGYYGGGGGAGSTSATTTVYAGGGGGGSSYINTTYVSSGVNTQGTNGSGGGLKTAPNNSDPDYLSHTGESGYTSGGIIYGGIDGLVVIYW